jgi:hypothetical protein
MAMSKADYFNIGVLAAKNGGVRISGNSWQAKSEQEGFDSVVIDKRGTHSISESEVKSLINMLPESKPTYQFYKQTPIQSHIDCLTAEFLSEPANSKRYHRLAAKIKLLRVKHFS